MARLVAIAADDAQWQEDLAWFDGQIAQLQHVPAGVNRDSQNAPEERV